MKEDKAQPSKGGKFVRLAAKVVSDCSRCGGTAGEMLTINPQVHASIDQCAEFIETLEAGPETDALVAEKMMGWKLCVRTGRPDHRKSKDHPGMMFDEWDAKGDHKYLESPDGWRVYFCSCDDNTAIDLYSADIAAAWRVAGSVRDKGFWVLIQWMADNPVTRNKDGVKVEFRSELKDGPTFSAWAEHGQVALAICRAALKVVLTPGV